jgi:predicted nuclease with TOPRIM domain
MSDEPTKDIAEKHDTKPTIETVLEMMVSLRDEMRAGFARIESRVDQLDIRLDRIESEVKKTHSEFYDLRADFKEMKSELKVHEPR